MKKKFFNIAISTCPNDTFIFDALIHHKIDTKDFEFSFIYKDIEQLNNLASLSKADIIKISFHAFYYLAEQYVLLNSGSAIGRNCGPLIISKNPFKKEDIPKLSIAIPGKHTTAYFLLKQLYGEIEKTEEVLFSEIERWLINDKVDCGLIIHETRFTYEQSGLMKLADLGELWEQKTGSLVPLGGIAAKRSIQKSDLLKINELIRQSIEYAIKNPDSSKDFIKGKSQIEDDTVIKKHIELYVNEYSQDLGELGKESILFMLQQKSLEEGEQKRFSQQNIFIT